MEFFRISTIPVLCAAALVWCLAPRAASAAELEFTGVVDLILAEEAASIYAPLFPVGTSVAGRIDDPGGEGSIGPAPTGPTSISIPFTCCIFAGLDEGAADIGLELTDDETLDADFADTLNLLFGPGTFSAGQVVDIVDLEGDRAVGSGRFEAGISLIFASDQYGASEVPDILGDFASVLGAVFFVAEFDSAEEEVFSAVGKLTSLGPVTGPTPVPVPPAMALMITALAACGALGRRRTAARS